MVTTRRSGFTLIEFMVAIGVLMAVLTGTFMALGSYYRMQAVQTDEILLQQNFRYAMDTISSDARDATAFTNLGEISDNFRMSDSLTFTMPNGHIVSYDVEHPASGSTTWIIFRHEKETVGGTDVASSSGPVTEPINQVLNVYFVNSGTKAIVILVGAVGSGSNRRLVSSVSLLYARNRSG